MALLISLTPSSELFTSILPSRRISVLSLQYDISSDFVQEENSSRDLKGWETRKQGTQPQKSALPQNNCLLLGVRLPKMSRATAQHMRPRSWYVFFSAKIGIVLIYQSLPLRLKFIFFGGDASFSRH